MILFLYNSAGKICVMKRIFWYIWARVQAYVFALRKQFIVDEIQFKVRVLIKD